MGKMYRDAVRRMNAHRSRVCSCNPARDPGCAVHGDAADIGRTGRFACPACVRFGREQCAQHKNSSLRALEDLYDQE